MPTGTGRSAAGDLYNHDQSRITQVPSLTGLLVELCSVGTAKSLQQLRSRFQEEVPGITWPPESDASNKQGVRDTALQKAVSKMKEQVARELRRGYENMVQQLADTTERAEQAEAKVEMLETALAVESDGTISATRVLANRMAELEQQVAEAHSAVMAARKEQQELRGQLGIDYDKDDTDINHHGLKQQLHLALEMEKAEALEDRRYAVEEREAAKRAGRRLKELLEQAQAAAQQAEASKQESEAAAVMAKAVAQDHAWRQGSSGASGRRQEAAAEVRSQAAAASAGGEEQLVEADRRREQHLHLRVAVKAGTVPARSAGQATLKQVLLDRLGMSEESVAQVMSTVSQVRVYPNKTGPGFTLIAHMTCPYSKHEVIRRRNRWRNNGSPGPALAIGHDLTPAQRDAHAKLFPVMRSLYERGLRQVEMIYYPAVCLRVCGRLYSDAAAATRAGEAALRSSSQATNASPRRASTGVGAGATQQAGPAPGGRPTQAAQAAAAQALRDLPAGQQGASPASPPPPPALPGPPPAAPPPSPLPGAAGVVQAAAGAAQEPAGLAPAGAAGSGGAAAGAAQGPAGVAPASATGAGQAAAGPEGPAGAN